MNTKNYQPPEHHWISLSDIMTVLMVIFMFIAISYIQKVRQEKEQRDEIVEQYNSTVERLYSRLQTEFAEDFKEDKWNAVISEDLSIRFLDERVFFQQGSDRIRSRFQQILDDFFSRYLNILLHEDFRDQIAEVRVEGHTDSTGDFIYNVNLSQDRTTKVLRHILFRDRQKTFENLSTTDQELVKFWFTANGFSFGRTIDSNGEFTLASDQPEDKQLSRRVEFRIVTRTDDVIEALSKLSSNDL